MKKVIMIQIENNEIITSELSKKGYEYYNSEKAQDNLDGMWDNWSDPLSKKEFIEKLEI